MTWSASRIIEGYGGDGGEIEVYGTVISPAPDDEFRRNSLDIKEAAEYINLLENAMDNVIEQAFEYLSGDSEAYPRVFDRINDMAAILNADAWTLLRARQQKETDNGTPS